MVMEWNGVEFEGFEGEGGGVSGKCLSSFIDEGSQESHRYYLSRKTVLEMLKDRGFNVPTSEINLSLQEFRALHGPNPDIDRLKFSTTHSSHPSNRVLVFFCGPGVVKVNAIRLIFGQISNRDGLTGLILILQNQMTSQATKAVEQFPCKVEIFQIDNLTLRSRSYAPLAPQKNKISLDTLRLWKKDTSTSHHYLIKLLATNS